MAVVQRHREVKQDDSLVAVDRFIQATRDSGYKGTSSAVAELVDNAIQARATRIVISIDTDEVDPDGAARVEVLDNGSGMDATVLQQALRFGGSTRFNNRQGLGRYGMGLPNSSLSQARRVEVWTWQTPKTAVTSYLDVDEIASGQVTRVPKPERAQRPSGAAALGFVSGTSVLWSRCDRLDHRRAATVASKLRPFLGRVFRYFLWDGVRIEVNGELVKPIDPLYLHERSLTCGGRLFGAPLVYEVEIPSSNGKGKAAGRVSVRFSELPVGEWHHLSNEEKRRLGVFKAAGVSVVRAGREIEYGWLLMGGKRKENYDDWWRCEVRFEPGLDEAFGITHTKQQVRPTHELAQVLVPDLEATAKTLNRRVREAHERLKAAARVADSEAVATAKDRLLPPLPKVRLNATGRRSFQALERRHPRLALNNRADSDQTRLRYAVVEGEADGTRFFESYRRDGQIVLALNREHPFFKRFYRLLNEREDESSQALRRQLDLILLAAARAEAQVGTRADRFLDTWSDAIATFLI